MAWAYTNHEIDQSYASVYRSTNLEHLQEYSKVSQSRNFGKIEKTHLQQLPNPPLNLLALGQTTTTRGYIREHIIAPI
jgi:hypothetical protein